MAGAGQNAAAAGGDRDGRLRASRGDREQVIDTLKAAFVQGMLAKDEFDLRVSQAFASRSYAELAAVTADLPAEPTAARPPPPAQGQAEVRIPRAGLVIMAVTVVYAAVLALAFALPRSGQDHEPHVGLALLATFFYLFFLPLAGAQMVSEWLDKHFRRRLTRGPAPGAGGQPSRRLP